MTSKQRTRCQKIAQTYGLKHQEEQTISELSELLHVLTRRPSQRGIDWKNNLLDEIADVLIMCEQVRYLHNIEIEEVSQRIDYKLNRQLDRMNNF